jgi:hypothetical protein
MRAVLERRPHLGSARQLVLDELDQGADRGKSSALDFVILHHEAEAVLKTGYQGNNSHRIKFGNRTQQGGARGKFCRTAFQTQSFIQYRQHLFFSVQA